LTTPFDPLPAGPTKSHAPSVHLAVTLHAEKLDALRQLR